MHLNAKVVECHAKCRDNQCAAAPFSYTNAIFMCACVRVIHLNERDALNPYAAVRYNACE